MTLLARRRGSLQGVIVFGLITLVFFYTTIVNVIERPEGIRIAACFIGAIVIASLVSRVWRSTELRAERVDFDDTARQFIEESGAGLIRLVANRRNIGSEFEYALKEQQVREDNHIPGKEPVLFLEIQVSDASNFSGVIEVKGVQVSQYCVLRAYGAAIPNTIAAILLSIRDQTGCIPHAYFGWIEGNPIQYLLRFILFGEGDIAIVTREVLRQAERNPLRRPAIHVGG